MRKIRRTLPGGASHAITIAGLVKASSAIAASLDLVVDGNAGASAGGVLALCESFGVPHDFQRAMIEELLQNNRVLDFAPPDLRFGLCRWEVIAEMCDRVFGKGARLGDASSAVVVGVTDVTLGGMRYLSKRDTPHVLVREAASATAAFPGAAGFIPIPSLTRNEWHRFSDSGVIDNTCDAVFDALDSPPRLGFRLVDPSPEVMRFDDGGSWPQGMAALFRASRVSANLVKSKRTDGLMIDVEAVGDGLDFSLTKTQLRTRHANGVAAVEARRNDIARVFCGEGEDP
jgi:hypothetical protein